jgi:hypothetical protein
MVTETDGYRQTGVKSQGGERGRRKIESKRARKTDVRVRVRVQHAALIRSLEHLPGPSRT